MAKTEYIRVSLPLPLGQALGDRLKKISPHLTLKDVVCWACMEFLERHASTQAQSKNQSEGKIEVEKEEEDVFGFSNFLD